MTGAPSPVMHPFPAPFTDRPLSAPPVLAHARQGSPPLYGHGASMQRHEIGRALAQCYLPIGLLIFRGGKLLCSFFKFRLGHQPAAR